ncbi:hypothetical protein LOH54_07070 [Sulfurimonas sp. HSL-3221]|uniref:hypothetical protein n=1 Tax=Sulfurimonadaceae TaxID=2771471 RepID=UPI001E512BDA|nr:hypothetical protein [Sulfurimonas sp. HSL-3221]UFS61421.1 hypothetical protein LOH54_07070 [Sulfurimonas sp. HSL-3221]
MMYLFVFGTWIMLLAWLAIDLHKRGPWALFFGTIILTMYGAVPAIGLTMDGDTLNNTAMKYIGQMLMVFISVLGGALMSLAFTELRKMSIEKQKAKEIAKER